MSIWLNVHCVGHGRCMATSARSLNLAVPAGPPIASAFGVRSMFKPGPGDLRFNVKNIINVLARVDYLKLPCLAVELDLADILGEIEAARVPDQARKHLATKWYQRCPPGIANHGWEILANALRSPIVGENRLASDLERWCIRRDSGTSTLSSSSGSEPYSPCSPVSIGSSSTEERGKDSIPHFLGSILIFTVLAVNYQATKTLACVQMELYWTYFFNDSLCRSRPNTG